MIGPDYATAPRPVETAEDRARPDRQGGILALDVATTTGWCYVYPGNKPVFGHERAGAAGAKDGEVCHRFMLFCDGLFIQFRPQHVCYEAPYIPVRRKEKGMRFAGERAPSFDTDPILNVYVVARLYALTRLVDMVAYERGVQCKEVGGLEWCRWFTGMKSWGGREKKKLATLAAAVRWGFPTNSEDEADAIGIALYSESILAPKIAHMRALGPRGELALDPSTPHRDRIGRRVLS